MRFDEFQDALSYAIERASRIGGNWRVMVFAGSDTPAVTYTNVDVPRPQAIMDGIKWIGGYCFFIHEMSRSTEIVSIESVTHISVRS